MSTDQPPGATPDTLWRISAFERERSTSHGGLGQRSTLLPSSLIGELGRIERSPWRGDALEVLAACVRQREPALLLLAHAGLVWPVTVFPREGLYHCPRDMLDVLAPGTRDLRLLALDPPGVRAPGHWERERVAEAVHYRPLGSLAWALALRGPRATLLDDLAGPVAFRITADFHLGSLPVPGSLGPAVQRLRVEIASAAGIARWPGMSAERAARLLNALYLQRGLMVLRSAQAARESQPRGWLGRIAERLRRH